MLKKIRTFINCFAVKRMHNMLNKKAFEELLTKYWPDECDTIGHQYVNYIMEHTLKGEFDKNRLFESSRGVHAYGVMEAIDTIIAAAALILNSVQLVQSLRDKNRDELKNEITKGAAPLIEDKVARESLAKEIVEERMNQ
jgi:hypothetical protein